jgi:uncharacterized protein (UPF0332 family)
MIEECAVTSEEARLSLAQREFDESQREWGAAHLLAAHAFYRQAVACAYFASFHAAQGLLAAHGLDAGTHEGVQRLTGLHFVVPGLLPKDAGRALSALSSRRHEADYRLLVEVDAAAWLAARTDAATFLAAARSYLAGAFPQLSLPIEADPQ